MVERVRIKVSGIVQGVGFRPYVYNLAESLNLRGYVTNTSEGVDIDVEGEKVSDFLERLSKEAPPLSEIARIDVYPSPVCGYADFRIIESSDGDRFTLVSPDVSVCNDCLRELFDPDNRRYLYPFINCTNCGPRYTITKAVPYDRPNTTMSVFEICDECYKEYNDPKDRRFHAQPNACARCGPQVEFKIQDSRFKINEKGNPIEAAIRLLKEGAIVAIKGLGGFHIACDATNEDAVRRLRKRKRRSNKPFALMAPDVMGVKRFCDVSEEERMLLQDRRRPIVLLRKRSMDGNPSVGGLSEKIAPKNKYLGFMLPYTPLHYLLFYYPITRAITNNSKESSPVTFHSSLVTNFDALVMTSGNISEEPIVKDNEEAMRRLSGIADAFLLHNRDIFMRVDDSVVRVTSNEKIATSNELRVSAAATFSLQSSAFSLTRYLSLSFIRRSRGFVPEPVLLHDDGPDVLGCGADLKNTFTVTKGRFAIPSQHIGDMDNYETLRFFEESLENIKAVYRVKPVAIAHDLHPDYLSTRWALSQIPSNSPLGPKIFGIQHHYAHIASVMAENGLRSKVIGVAFDGTGYGTDGNLWGGEFLIADIDGFERAGHLRYIPLPGGEMAIKEPWRTGVSYAVDALKDTDSLEAIGFVEKYGRDNIEKLIRIAQVRELSPLSSGAGRLFDAVSAIMGICDRNTFEGEAAMALESIVAEGIDEGYPVEVALSEERGKIVSSPRFVVNFSQTIIGIIQDLIGGVDRPVISAKFHNTISSAILSVVKRIAADYGLNDVVLSGGTFQNLYLLERTARMLAAHGMNVFINRKVPCNDAGISLGQAYLIRERLRYGVHHG
ncbi:MAG: carbamoyltransferase HypF [Thermodesulfovibrionales bacterium]